MVPIKKNLVDKSKYSIKCPYEMTPTRIVIHNTANDAPAANEVAYMIRNDNQVSFHFAVDDKEIIQGVEENRNTWNAGDGNGKGNREGISIEICYSKSGGSKFTEAEKNAAEFAASLLKKYGWGIDKITKHQDYNGKYCPHRTLDQGWDRFLKMVDGYLNPAKEIYRVRKSWLNAISQKGAFKDLDNAIACCDKAGNTYKVYNSKGEIVYEIKQTTPTSTSTILKKGSKGEAVKALQQNLNSLGYNCGTVDGSFGNNTEKAVKAFQKANSLTQDGIVGTATQKALTNALTAAAKKIDVIYQVWDDVNNKWLPNVKNDEEYAGIFGHDICAVYANLSSGNITYQVHAKGSKWYGEIKNRSDYAGVFNKPIDAIRMKTDTGKKIEYRVHLRKQNRWLSWISGYNTSDAANGYAGILGQEIDGLQIRIK